MPSKTEQIAVLQERIDLDVDEFQRIIAELDDCLIGLCGDKAATRAKIVVGICQRAITAGRQRVPLIQQRDKAEAEVVKLKDTISKLDDERRSFAFLAKEPNLYETDKVARGVLSNLITQLQMGDPISNKTYQGMLDTLHGRA